MTIVAKLGVSQLKILLKKLMDERFMGHLSLCELIGYMDMECKN